MEHPQWCLARPEFDDFLWGKYHPLGEPMPTSTPEITTLLWLSQTQVLVAYLKRENWWRGVYGSFKCVKWELSETIQGIWSAGTVGLRNDPVVVDLALHKWADWEHRTWFHECTTEKPIHLPLIPWFHKLRQKKKRSIIPVTHVTRWYAAEIAPALSPQLSETHETDDFH